MIKIRTLALAAGLALSAVSMAHADGAVTGKWTYKIGATGTPCSVTLEADANDSRGGNIVSGDKCPGGLAAIGHWRTMGTRLQLMSPSGNLVAVLGPKDGGYVGKQIGGGRKVALSR